MKKKAVLQSLKENQEFIEIFFCHPNTVFLLKPPFRFAKDLLEETSMYEVPKRK